MNRATIRSPYSNESLAHFVAEILVVDVDTQQRDLRNEQGNDSISLFKRVSCTLLHSLPENGEFSHLAIGHHRLIDRRSLKCARESIRGNRAREKKSNRRFHSGLSHPTLAV